MSMGDWLNNLPIHRKLWIFNLLTAMVSGIVSAAMLIVVIWNVEYAGASADASIKAAIIAENAVPALQFSDARTATEILAGLARDGAIIDARIVKPDGQVFAAFVRDPTHDGGHGVGRIIRIDRPIIADHQLLATLELTSDTDRVAQQIMTYVGAVALATAVALIVGGFVVLRLQRAITNPLSYLTRLMKDVSSGGDLSRRALVPTHDELGELGESFNRMIEQIELRNVALSRELSERVQAEKRLEHLAHHDQVTGLPNRHFFRLRTSELLRGSSLGEGTKAFFFIDLDNFKYINDTFGHDFGDKVLVAVADRLSSSVRAHDMVVRFGGDEFVVLLDGIGDAAQSMRVAQKLHTAITRPIEVGEQTFYVGCSIGIALAPDHAGNFDELLQKADAAMYAAKTAGKNGIKIWEPAISYDTTTRFALESDLRQALINGELEMHYQPVVVLATGRIVGMEALMRWRHPSRGFVSPAEFIPVAEDTGLILELGEWAMRTAFSQAAQWNTRFGPLFVAVNVSGRQLRDRDFPARAEATALASGLAREMSELEVTESIIMGHSGEAVRLLEDLSERGFSLSLDDFGTGYSSLSYLKRFRLDKLKIDRSFVKDLPEDLEDAAIAEAIVGLAKTLSMTVVAEGVETAAQANMLIDIGCIYGQGYYFSRPLPVAQMSEFIAGNLATTPHWTRERNRRAKAGSLAP